MSQPIFPQAIKNAAATLENGDGTTAKDLVTAGTNGSRIDSIAVTSDDTADKDIFIYLNDGTTDFLLGRLTIKAGSGTDGTNKTVAALNSTDLPFLKDDLSYYLQAGHKLRVAAQAAVTSGKKITVTAWIGDY